MRIAILGLGLIGGSMARALRESAPGLDGRPVLVAWSPSGRGPAEALAEGVVDDVVADPAAAVEGADLVVLAAPPLACLDLLPTLAALRGGPLEVDATITDVASTKRRLLEAADRLGLPFVGGHPMAGLEATGFGAARADLFAGRPWVVCAGASARASDVVRVVDLAIACGARPMPMDATEHDRAVAGISHLPLVVAAALVETVAGTDDATTDRTSAASLAAGGWASATRLAAGSPEMGAGILATNASEVRERISALVRVLTSWEAALGEDASQARASGATEGQAADRAEMDRAEMDRVATDAVATDAVAAAIEVRLRAARDRLRADSERVLVVPRAAIMDEVGWYGLRTDDPGTFLEAVRREGRFEPRGRMETDPRYKQVIPYVVLRDGERIFLMRRTRGGADARLHDRWSIGVGGHVGPADGDLQGGLVREWTEELDAAFVPEFRLVGLLNDDTTDVGRVHVGAVFVADAHGRPVAVRETDKLTGSFVPLVEARAVADDMETWSRLLIGPVTDGAVR